MPQPSDHPIVTLAGIVLAHATWARVSELSPSDVPRVRMMGAGALCVWRADRPLAEEGHPALCNDLPALAPAPGSWEAYLAGGMTLGAFAALNPGVGVGYAGPGATAPYWTTDRLWCMANCPGGAWCSPLGHWIVDAPAATAWYWRHEIHGEGGDVRVDVPCGAAIRWVVQGGPAGFVDAFDPCDVDLDGSRTIHDFGALLNQFTGGWDWNGDGAANVNDFVAYLDRWTAGPCP